MATHYTIQADVVDISIDRPWNTDAFLVDTNVWYWMTYSRASQCLRPPARYQTSNYPSYTNAALSIGARIFQSGLSLAELTHLIEKAEYEIFARANPVIFPDPNRFNKNFRHDRNKEREQVVSEIKAAWAQVDDLAEPLTVVIEESVTKAALSHLQTEKVDGYDLFILESMEKHGVKKIITDDGDFATVSDIQVFTANHNVIQAARSQGKLITRCH